MGFGLDDALNVATWGIYKAVNPSYTTQSQKVLETPEQREARRKLLEFAKTGKIGNYTAGADIGIRPGNYNVTGLEEGGLNSLQNLLTSTLPPQFQMGDTALSTLLNTNPEYIQSQFDPFKAQIQREIRDSETALKRSAGYGGNLYSTNTIRGLGDIRARGNETLTAKLAELTNEALNRRLQAIPLAYQSGTAQEGLTQNRITSAMNYGGLTRDLSNLSTAEFNNELLRRRTEMQAPLNALQSVASTNAQFGVPSVQVPEANPMFDLLLALVSGGSKVAGARGAG